MERKDFGSTNISENTSLYILKNDEMEISVTDFGTSLVSLKVPDRNNNLTDIVFGFDCAADYENDDTNFGCNVARNANRIGGASFELNGITYELDANDGNNSLHSGFNPSFKRMWKLEDVQDDKISFSLFSPDKDQGFPGNVQIFTTYELLPNRTLKITFEGTPDADTVMNITNHSYFNLNGCDSESCLNHLLTIDADSFTPSDAESIPTGEIVPVAGTPMDFTKEKSIGQDFDCDFVQLIQAKGYDHNWCINDYDGSLKHAIHVRSNDTGIVMDVFTDYPGVQVYSANYTHNVVGKNGVVHNEQSAVCFEPQFYPDSVNKRNFVSPICRAGHKFHKEIVYKFSNF